MGSSSTTITAFPATQCLTASELVQLIKDGEKNDRRFCFILGSGASVESDIPAGNQLEMTWMNCLMGKAQDKNDNTPPMSQQMTKERASRFPVAIAGNDKSNLPVLEHDFSEITAAWKKACEEGKTSLDSKYYFDIYKLRFYPFYANGFRYLENLMEKAEPSLGYHTLALLLTETKGNNLIITTNFDTLVEDSLYLYTNKKPLVINHDLLAQYVDHNKRTRPIIAKLHHGLFFDPMNTNEVNDEWIKAWSNVLAEVFRNYIPVVIGYGGGDTSLMRILNSDAIRMREGILWCTRNENGYESDNPEVCAVVEKHNGFFVKIKGFDDLMLRIGNAMFLEKISTEATKNHLEAQTMKRIKAYEDKYKELTKDDLNGKTNLSLSADDYYQKGNHLMARGKYSKAIEFLSKAIDLDPTYTLAYRDRGLVKFLMSKFGTAIEDLTKAIELDQTDYSAYTIRGIVWEALKKYNEAIEDFSKAIALNPTDISPYNNRGNAWASCGKHDNAVEDYSRAIEIDPENFISYVGRGNSWNDLKDYDRAITDFSKALQINPINSAAYNGRGNSWTYLKQYNKAIEDYSQAIAMNSDYIDAYRNRSVAYHFLGNNDLAEADRKKAAELESKTT